MASTEKLFSMESSFRGLSNNMNPDKKAILIGAYPIGDFEVLKKEREGAFLLCCDGGYKTLEKLGVEPDLFVGDFDTLPKKELKNPKEVITLNPVKDDTDTFYAVKWALEKGFTTFYFFGCLGGKVEHSLANIQVLSYLIDHKARGFLFSSDSKTVLTMGENETFRFKKDAKGMFSLFSYTPNALVTEKNLKYTLDKAELSSSIPLGVSNEFIGEEAEVTIHQGKVILVYPYGGLIR